MCAHPARPPQGARRPGRQTNACSSCWPGTPLGSGALIGSGPGGVEGRRVAGNRAAGARKGMADGRQAEGRLDRPEHPARRCRAPSRLCLAAAARTAGGLAAVDAGSETPRGGGTGPSRRGARPPAARLVRRAPPRPPSASRARCAPRACRATRGRPGRRRRSRRAKRLGLYKVCTGSFAYTKQAPLFSPGGFPRRSASMDGSRGLLARERARPGTAETSASFVATPCRSATTFRHPDTLSRFLSRFRRTPPGV